MLSSIIWKLCSDANIQNEVLPSSIQALKNGRGLSACLDIPKLLQKCISLPQNSSVCRLHSTLTVHSCLQLAYHTEMHWHFRHYVGLLAYIRSNAAHYILTFCLLPPNAFREQFKCRKLENV